MNVRDVASAASPRLRDGVARPASASPRKYVITSPASHARKSPSCPPSRNHRLPRPPSDSPNQRSKPGFVSPPVVLASSTRPVFYTAMPLLLAPRSTAAAPLLSARSMASFCHRFCREVRTAVVVFGNIHLAPSTGSPPTTTTTLPRSSTRTPAPCRTRRSSSSLGGSPPSSGPDPLGGLPEAASMRIGNARHHPHWWPLPCSC